MSKISSEFIMGSAIGYFFSNNLLVFSLGVATGVIIQEKFGSVYKFSEFCYDRSKEILKEQLSKLTGRLSRSNKNNLEIDIIDDILEEMQNDRDKVDNANNQESEESEDEPSDNHETFKLDTANKNANSLKNKEE